MKAQARRRTQKSTTTFQTNNVPQGEADGNIEVEGKQNSLFPEAPVIKCFAIPPTQK